MTGGPGHTASRASETATPAGLVICAAGAAALAFTATASAQDWKGKYPELTFAVVPAENASGVTERWTPFVAYLSKELGVKVTLRIAAQFADIWHGFGDPETYKRKIAVLVHGGS